MAKAEVALLRCTLLLLFPPVSLSQRDCSSVDCPPLENCIKEALESDGCCTSCLQKGCRCEGYQRYDCPRAGFKNGIVPEGQSYFVDYGSTECSCPVGGGPISCRYIGCPDLPTNCIETLEPEDGCQQCERIGCVHRGEKYEAGHSFHVEACRVCHCPAEGGKLMCYPDPDCDPQLTLITDDNASNGRDGFFTSFDQLSASYNRPSSEILPHFIPSPSDDNEPEEYDYSHADFSEPYVDLFALPTQPSIFSNKVASLGSERSERTSSLLGLEVPKRMELREQYRVHPHLSEKVVTQVPSAAEQSTASPSLNATASWQDQQYTQTPSGKGVDSHSGLEYPLYAHPSLGSVALPVNNLNNVEENSEGDLHHQRSTKMEVHSHNASGAVTPKSSVSQLNRSHLMRGTENIPDQDRVEFPLYTLKNMDTPDDSNSRAHFPEELHEPDGADWFNQEERESLPGTVDSVRTIQNEKSRNSFESSSPSQGNPEYRQTTTAYLIPAASHPPAVIRPLESQLGGDVPRSPDSVDLKAEGNGEGNEAHSPEGDPGESFEDMLQSCCAAGQKRAREKRYCKNIPALRDKHSVCSVVEQQCCLSQVKESRCDSGVAAARAGRACKADVNDSCTDEYQVCCSCCAIGLSMHSEGQGCNAHKYLSYPCGHIFLSCCEDDEGQSQSPLWTQEESRPTAVPKPVSPTTDSQVEDLTSSTSTATTTHTTVTSTSPAHLHPCAGESGCSQRCAAVAGQARCSCFPGFSLMTDRRTCKDVDECQSNTHSCRPNQRCVNTLGSFLCELQVRCPAGYQMKSGVCQDIDECIVNTHSCGESSVCENTAGSFRCNSKLKCVSGFMLDSHDNCIDINECSILSEPCTAGSVCINTVGSYTCQQKTLMCNKGYHSSSNGTKCVDTDECQMGTHRCGAGQICQNLPGSYRCDCQTGYQYDAFRKVCTDINECWRFPGRLCAQTCENTKGSYRCSCTTGFSLAVDGNNCEDVNECDSNPCSQECVNIYGSYQCYCREGYYLKEDRHTCEDIDECSQAIGNLCVFQCVNVVGSYRCACPPQGYVAAVNGRSCKDIDECMTGSHNCSFSQTCYNLQGSFKCLSFDCPQNYKKVSDTHCERIGCPPNSIDCQNSPLRITYHQLNFKTNAITPAQIFRIGPSPVYSGDNIVISIVKGNEGGYFSARKLNSFTGAVYLQRKVGDPKDFLIDVEMKLLRKGTFTSFLSRLYIFITSNKM
ncbi:fibulin-2 [Poecilia formosa]|uniref:Fibulin 2 n=1 Tax=Poecilia formosa TaxID=48698 RepID=A0A087XV79_POEFO|nr:PREDICTED: fibulin-2-like [Poecilia formosa]XP_016516846.1 PREDICTED: fibulin-2-like [Poecilia formosa]